jgi:hypothetical protein
MAKRILIAEAALVGALGLVVLTREIPGLVREIRIWRMAQFRSGVRHARRGE